MQTISRNESDNLIYNRFDLIHKGQENYYSFDYDDVCYEFQEYHNDGISSINVWGKDIPQDVFNHLVCSIFTNKEIYSIEVTRGKNPYGMFLEQTNDIRVPLPCSFDDLMNRAERRDRATIRRKLRWLDERIGDFRIDVFSRDEIPLSIVNTYFVWKKETHGTEYGLLPEEYLDKYHVTDGMVMRAGNIDIAVAFFCQVKDIVFFENFSYNVELKEYSPGLLMYVKFMEELIHRGCRYLYLGGGGYIYKKRFGAEAFIAYSGIIYRQEILDSLNLYFKNRSMKRVAFYGYGVCGHSFYQLSKNLNIDVVYGIDRNAGVQENPIVYAPGTDFPDADAVLITMNSRNEDIEKLLSKRFDFVFYWNDILNEVVNNYKRSVNEIN